LICEEDEGMTLDEIHKLQYEHGLVA